MLYFLVFIVALIPRFLYVGFDVFNTDAFFWRENTYNFMGLLEKHQWADTAITHHPGVILMWLGGVGMKIFRGLYVLINHVSAPDDQAAVLWTNFWQVLPIAMVVTLTIVLGVYLLRKLGGIGDKGAILVGFLLATEPWFIAHSRVFNTDALMTSFMFLSVLCLWLAVKEEKFKKWAILSGMFGGLGLLTKSISLFVIPFVFLTLLLAFFIKKTSLRKLLVICCLFFVSCSLLFVVFWPAMWADPLGTLRLYFSGIFLEGSSRLNLHNMFGNPTLNPGPVFYPLVFLFRLTPELIVLGVIGVTGAIRRFWRRQPADQNLLFLGLSALSFIIFYTLEITLATKKLDRYFLPTLPFIAIFAAYGGLVVYRWVVGAIRDIGGIKIRKILVLCFLLFGIYRLSVLVAYFPDYLAYYNPIVGGPTQGYNFDGEWWGEGYHKVGDYLNSRNDVKSVAAYDQRQLRPLVKDSVVVYDAGDKNLDPTKVDLWVLRYRGNGQRDDYQLVKTLYVFNYPMWGVYEKL